MPKPTAIKAKPIGVPVALTYRKRPGGRAYAHTFGTKPRIGVVGRYLVIGPIAVKNGDIHG